MQIRNVLIEKKEEIVHFWALTYWNYVLGDLREPQDKIRASQIGSFDIIFEEKK